MLSAESVAHSCPPSAMLVRHPALEELTDCCRQWRHKASFMHEVGSKNKGPPKRRARDPAMSVPIFATAGPLEEMESSIPRQPGVCLRSQGSPGSCPGSPGSTRCSALLDCCYGG